MTELLVADRADRYDRLLRLADLFDSAGDDLRARAGLGAELLRDPALGESAELAASTHRQVEEDVRAATTGRGGIRTRSLELDADALVVRATVLTYQWIDELREAASRSLGSIAGRAIGYLAPSVALGGAIVSAGLIETDALDRDGVAAYLSELATANPELMDHVTSGGGGLLDSLQMRALLTAGVLSGDPGRQAARGGLSALGIETMRHDSSAAVRDAAGGLLSLDRPDPTLGPAGAAGAAGADGSMRLRSVADLMRVLQDLDRPLLVRQSAPGRAVAFVGAPPLPDDLDDDAGPGLVGGDLETHAARVSAAITAALGEDAGAHVLLVGGGAGGAVAALVAARPANDGFVVDSLVTAGAPGAQVPRLPATVRMLALEDRADPVALLGSLLAAGDPQRTTVTFDAAGTSGEGVYVAGGRAADGSVHPELVAELQRLRDLGYLSPTG